jgi:fructooligosaccharide transport system substrate-binding protein
MAQRSQRLTRRAFLTIAAGTAGAGLLAACGGPATQPPVTAPPGAPPTAPSGTSAAGATPRVTASSTSSTGTPTAGTAFNNATIRAWIFGDTGGDVNLEAQTTRRIVEAFGQRYQGRIAVDITPIANPDTDYQDKVQSAAAAKQLPDVLQLDGPFVADYAYRKILGPIGAYFTPDDLGDFVPSIIEQGTWRGKLWSLGAFSSSMGVMVNQTLFAQAGITAPTDIPAAWAWPQFAEAARRLTGNGVRGLDMHLDYGVSDWFTYAVSPFIWSAGGDLLAPDQSRATGFVNGSAAVNVLTEFQRLFKDDSISATPDPKAFEKGQVAMQIIGAWVIEGFKDFPDLHWTIMPLPYFTTKVSPSGSYAWGIGGTTKNPAAAAELLRWLVATDTGIVPIVETNKLPPARRSAYPKLPFYAAAPYALYGEQLQQTAKARPVTPAYPVLTAKFAEAINDIALGSPVQGRLDAVARAVDDDITRNNGYQS